jgi:hypothetical protein
MQYLVYRMCTSREADNGNVGRITYKHFSAMNAKTGSREKHMCVLTSKHPDVRFHPQKSKPLIFEAVVAVHFRMPITRIFIGEVSECREPITNVHPYLIPERRDVLSLRGEAVRGAELEKPRVKGNVNNFEDENEKRKMHKTDVPTVYVDPNGVRRLSCVGRERRRANDIHKEAVKIKTSKIRGLNVIDWPE